MLNKILDFLIFFTFSVFFILICVWIYIFKIDIVSISNGEVLPATKVKIIQHLEGGIVSKINVLEGAFVTKGQNLLLLEKHIISANIEELNTRLANLEVEKFRLKTEASGLKIIKFPNTLIQKYPKIVQFNKKLFEIKIKKLLNEIDIQHKHIQEVRHRKTELEKRIKNANKSLILLLEQIEISNKLLEEELTNRYNHIDLLKSKQNLLGAIEGDVESLKRVSFSIQKEQSIFRKIDIVFREDARQQFIDYQRQFNELKKRLKKYQDSFIRSVIRSPVDGVVKTVYFNTIGGVVKPGEPIMEIVPNDDKLIVEVQLSTDDIGYVHLGQKAKLKLNAPSLFKYGSIAGEVINISPDRLVRESDGLPYFRVHISPFQNYFEANTERYEIFSGSQISAYIIIGERSIFEYLVEPFKVSFSEALHEK